MSTIIIGAQLDNYRIVEKIGEGGMGSVYRAVDVMLERDVALKFLRPELSREPELVQRFRHEAVLLARLNHQFIAPIFGLHRYGEELFIAMEYVPGETLEGRLKRIERLPADSALHVTAMVLQALDYAHRLGVVHRDIKPANVIMTPGGIVKVMDFGIARVLGSERRTRAGSIVGTIAYMAPEQIQGADADHRADLYAVGILLYEMLTGHAPFQADTDWALMQAQIAKTPDPLRGQVDVSEAVEAAVLRALEKSPEKRFQAATEFQAALETAARELNPDAPPLSATTGAFFQPPRPTILTGAPNTDETRVGFPTPVPGTPFPPTTVLPSPGTVAPAPAGGTPALAGRMPDETRLVGAVPAAPGPPPASSAAPPPPAVPPVAHVASVAPPPAAAHVAPRALPHAPAAKKAKSSGLGLALGAGALMLVLVGGAVAWVLSGRGPDPDPAALNPESTAAENTAVAPPTPAPATPVVPAPSPPPGPAPAATAAAPRPRPAAPAAAQPGAPVVTTPAPPPEASAAPPPVRSVPAAPLANLPDTVFKDARMVRRNGPEIDVELHFGANQLAVTNVGGRNVLGALPYSQISAEYYESRHTRVFVRTMRYWLRLQGPSGAGFLLRVERDAVKPIVAEFEKRSGREVVTTATQEETEQQQ